MKTEILVITEDENKEFEIYSDMAHEIVKKSSEIEVTDSLSAEMAVTFAAKAKSLSRKIDDTRKAITEPARHFISGVNFLAKKFTGMMEQAEKNITDKIEHYKLREDARRISQEQQRDALLFFDSSVPVVTYDDLSKITGKGASFSEKTVWSYELKSLSEVPKEYLSVNDSAVKAAIKNGIRHIPGLDIRCEQKLQ